MTATHDKARYDERKLMGLCVWCGINAPMPGRVQCVNCTQKIKERLERRINGGKCRQCGELAVHGYTHCPLCLLKDWLRSHRRRCVQKCFYDPLSDEELIHLTAKLCTYCGGLGARGFNGLDQKVPGAGYSLDNVQPCCSNCNYAKRTLGHEQFLSLCRRIAEYANRQAETQSSLHTN